LKIYDVLGREVKVLFNEIAPAGIVAVDFKPENLSSGVYIYQLTAENFTASRKLLLLK
jgi:hypothetical protein